MSALAARIEAESGRLVLRVLDEMYQNPFWLERFGERGRQFARQDGEYHVSYLVQALVAGDRQVLTGYTRWLQSVLTTRGMCSRHLDDNFARLARAIADSIDDAEQAVAFLGAARDALRYDAEAAAAIQDAASVLADATAAAMYDDHPEWAQRWGDAGRERCADDLRYHLSYLADATALNRPDLFLDYVRWIDSFLQRRGIPSDHLRETLEKLRQAMLHHESRWPAVHGGRAMLASALDQLPA